LAITIRDAMTAVDAGSHRVLDRHRPRMPGAWRSGAENRAVMVSLRVTGCHTTTPIDTLKRARSPVKDEDRGHF
jgi:hypothetical protein